MSTHRVSILGPSTIPDSTGEAFFEPYSILASNDQWRHLIIRLGSDNTVQPTVDHGVYGQFQVPQNYASAANLVIVWTATLITGDVEFDFRYRAIGGNDTESLDQTTEDEDVNLNDTAPSAAHERMELIIALTDSNFAIGDTVTFFLTRDGTDAGDTLAGSAILFDAYFEYSN